MAIRAPGGLVIMAAYRDGVHSADIVTMTFRADNLN
jgi:hypothetical protein